MKKIKLSDAKEMQMREPKVRDMKNVSHITNDFEKEITLISNLCQKTPNEIEELSMSDFAKLDKALQDFLL